MSDAEHVIRASNESSSGRSLLVGIGFNVERVVKGDFSASSVTVLYQITQCDTDSELTLDAVVGMKYIVFLNTSRSTSGTENSSTSLSPSVVYWSLGDIELFTANVQRTVLALACRQCGKLYK